MSSKRTLAAVLVIIILVSSVALYLVASNGGARTSSVSSTTGIVSTTSSTRLSNSSILPGNGSMTLAAAFPYLSFNRMVFLTSPDDGTDRMFLVLQVGEILEFPDERNVSSTATFLDLRNLVNSSGNEQGLLGLAFDPDFAANGYLYVYYTAAGAGRHAVVARFTVDASNAGMVDPSTELVILQISQPPAFNNHNGGMLAFGPDGDLYVGVGDGGSEGDPMGNGQNMSTLLGKVLRIDVGNASAEAPYSIPSDNPFVRVAGDRGEIWAYGLRNPWRFSFDPAGQLWVGDVGQDRFEEVDLVTKGGNYGWNIMEGFSCYSPPSGCDESGLKLPVIAYPHVQGDCAIIGGYVYTGKGIPSLDGAYVYGDYCTGNVWALEYNGTQVTYHAELVVGTSSMYSFGLDSSGNLYALSSDGHIYQLQAAS
ncbi:MAG: PQQ-dependent sugar dehydrogenase [Thaumarchaeota archaeon]|nr:PQQ-dependent sugar dehydrogenase [Nitrososphaerota archaeon]